VAEAVTTQIAEAPKKFLTAPVMAVTIGAIFLLLVLFLEAYKPGIITGPFKSLLNAVGVKKA
jgi:hypothetical protein